MCLGDEKSERGGKTRKAKGREKQQQRGGAEEWYVKRRRKLRK